MILAVLFLFLIAFFLCITIIFFFLIMEIPNQEEVQMASGKGRGGHGRDDDNEMNRNVQRRIVIMIPADSILTNMIVASMDDVTVTMLLDENLNANVNMNQTHIDLQILRVITPQANQNTVTRHQKGNQQQQV